MAAPDYGVPPSGLIGTEFDDRRRQAMMDELGTRRSRLQELLAQQSLSRMGGLASGTAGSVLNRRGVQDKLQAELAFGRARLAALDEERELQRQYASEAGRLYKLRQAGIESTAAEARQATKDARLNWIGSAIGDIGSGIGEELADRSRPRVQSEFSPTIGPYARAALGMPAEAQTPYELMSNPSAFRGYIGTTADMRRRYGSR